MKHTIKMRPADGSKLHISMRCDDECRNGHDTFAITGEYWEAGNTRRYEPDTAGCIHEIIAKYRPDLQPLIDLHLSDGDGMPWSPLSNGFYHLQGVQGTAPYGYTCTPKHFAEFMRIDIDTANVLIEHCHRQIEFAMFINAMEPVWKADADHGRAIIQALIDGKEPPKPPKREVQAAAEDVLHHLHKTSADAQSEVRQQIKKEAAERADRMREKIEAKHADTTQKADTERAVKLWVLENFPDDLDMVFNTIYYSTGNVVFGWYAPIQPGSARHHKLLDALDGGSFEFDYKIKYIGE